MKNISQSLKRNISEIKEKKNNLIIEHSIVQSRLEFVLEQKYKTKKHLAMSLLNEMINLEEQGFDLGQLNEQFNLFGFLGSLFGGSFKNIDSVIGEYLVDGIANKFGVNQGSYFYNVLKAAITNTNIADYGKFFTDCKFLVNTVCKALFEGLVLQQQEKREIGQDGAKGFLINALRNAIVDAIDESKVVAKLEGLVSGILCEAQAKWRQNITNLGQQLQTNLGTT